MTGEARVLAAWCGLRAVEVARLRRKFVRETGAEPVLIVNHDATKGERGRVIPLSPFVAGEIGAAGLPVTGWCFPRLDGQPGPLTAHRVSGLCNEYLHSLGYPDTFHSLRHRFGTEVYRSSRDLLETAALMGHASVESTQIYVEVAGVRGADAVRALPVPGRRLRSLPGKDSAA